MKLTDTSVRGIKATGKAKKLSDGGGLYLHVSPVGGKHWRMGYRFDGRQKTLSFGAYPAVSLKDARRKRDEAKELLAHGIDPSANKKAVRAAVRAEAGNTFEVIAREWFEKSKASWVSTHANKSIRRLESYIFPVVGAVPVNQVSAQELLSALRRIEERRANETARRTLQLCGQIFRYAIATGRAERDPAAALRGALAPVRSVGFATLQSPKPSAHCCGT